MDESVSSKSFIKKFAGLFTTILKLRRLCNNGTHQHISPLDSMELANTPIESMVNELTPGQNRACGFCSVQVFDNGRSVNLTTCTICLASLCDACMHKHDFTCGLYLESESYNSNSESPTRTSQTSEPSLLTYGCSTKLFMVVENIERNLQQTKRWEVSSRCRVEFNWSGKSLVFSQWTSTLDLLENLLRTRNIRTLRIDGRVTNRNRTEILSEFGENHAARVLLMSIGTGAVGCV